MVMAYEKFYRFYDLVMGDRSKAARYTQSLIEGHNPNAKTVLEIACGTGGILGFLADRYEVTGLDRSRQMLALARAKLPHIRFYCRDMTSFELGRQYDAVVCVSDSINHLLDFAHWKKVFHRVARQLNDGGVFVLDINTLGKLRRLVEDPPWVKQIDRDLVIIKVMGGQYGRFDWDVKIFEHRNRANYRLITETIEEAAFPLNRIDESLRTTFKTVKVFDPSGARPSDLSERVYFACRI